MSLYLWCISWRHHITFFLFNTFDISNLTEVLSSLTGWQIHSLETALKTEWYQYDWGGCCQRLNLGPWYVIMFICFFTAVSTAWVLDELDFPSVLYAPSWEDKEGALSRHLMRQGSCRVWSRSSALDPVMRLKRLRSQNVGDNIGSPLSQSYGKLFSLLFWIAISLYIFTADLGRHECNLVVLLMKTWGFVLGLVCREWASQF